MTFKFSPPYLYKAKTKEDLIEANSIRSSFFLFVIFYLNLVGIYINFKPASVMPKAHVQTLLATFNLTSKSLTTCILNLQETSIHAAIEFLVHCNKLVHNLFVILNTTCCKDTLFQSISNKQTSFFIDQDYIFDDCQSS